MKTVIMQPYLFPYIGYFQLLNSADKFVVYDDVQFIKNGWINRNQILVNGEGSYFTFQIKKASTFDKINEREFTDRIQTNIAKFLKGIEFAYRKAPCYDMAMPVIQEAVECSNMNVSQFVTHSLGVVCKYLDIGCEFILASELGIPENLRAQERVLWVNETLGSTWYINVAGGLELYDNETFAQRGLKLNFIRPKTIEYNQYKNDFVPNLSIIDVMMFNSKEKIANMLGEYELI